MTESSVTEIVDPVRRHKEIWVLIVTLLLAAALAVAIYAVWNYDREHPVTDDAAVQANFVWVRPQVEGQVVRLSVRPNQQVKAGDELFLIDPRSYQQQLLQAEKQLLLVKQQNIAGAADVNAAQAQIAEQQAAVKTASEYAQRYTRMAEKEAASQLSAIGYRNSLMTAQSKLLELQADLAKAVASLGGEEVQQARVDNARAAVALAKLKLEWTRVLAPADGYITQMALREGDVVQAGEQLFPFIESDQWWVQANFKETDIAGIKPGMLAKVSIDIYGERVFNGVVESLSAGSAASFALLPPQNTTGNWVKVTQRMPVRVRLPAMDPAYPYRYGASAEVVIQLDAPLQAAHAGKPAE
jgi:membrane fusion protein (multidrug efflux system)